MTSRSWTSDEIDSMASDVRALLDSGLTVDEAVKAWHAERPDLVVVGVRAFQKALGISHVDARRLVLGDRDLTDQFFDALITGIRDGEIQGTIIKDDHETGEVSLQFDLGVEE